MLSKCIGIISYFPNGKLREIRKNNFLNLINTLNEYFKLPIIIIAQNGSKEDFDLHYNNEIKIYSFNGPLGITKARIELRNKLLKEDYDYYIFLDDDINMKCTKFGVDKYFNEIDAHPNMFGQFSKMQLLAISKVMLEKMNWNYIKDLEASRGDVGEDVCYYNVYKRYYKNNFFQFSKGNIEMKLLASEKDDTSTGYNNDIIISEIRRNTLLMIDTGYNSLITNK